MRSMVAEIERDEFIDAIAAELREPVRLGADFDARVMAALDTGVIPLHGARELPERPWLLRKRTLRVSPLAGLAAAAALLLAVSLGAYRVATRTAPEVVASASPIELVPVADRGDGLAAELPVPATPFVYENPDAKSVSVVGAFNDWDPARTPLTRVSDSVWTATVPLTAGRHEYQFVIDGVRQIPDPAAAETVPTEFGDVNAVIVVSRGRR